MNLKRGKNNPAMKKVQRGKNFADYNANISNAQTGKFNIFLEA